MGDIAFRQKWDLSSKLNDELLDKYSNKAIEDFLGIVITEVDKKNYLYNVYKDGELVLAQIAPWDIKNIFEAAAASFADRMCDEADKENNLEETERMVAELKAKEIENERENYYICPICHDFVKKGTHFHL